MLYIFSILYRIDNIYIFTYIDIYHREGEEVISKKHVLIADLRTSKMMGKRRLGLKEGGGAIPCTNHCSLLPLEKRGPRKLREMTKLEDNYHVPFLRHVLSVPRIHHRS